MKFARRPTLVTWILFVELCALPFPWMSDIIGHRQPATLDKVSFAVLEFIPLAIALLVALQFRSLWKVALVCIVLRIIWQLLAWGGVFGAGRWPKGVAYPLWPESFTATFWDGSLPVGIWFAWANVYALAAVLLAMTCRNRDAAAKVEGLIL